MVDKFLIYISENVTRPAMYEQLAEECAELGKASLKMARALRGENPTPVTQKEAREMLREELNDLLTVVHALEIEDLVDEELQWQKLQRWGERIHAAKSGEAAATCCTETVDESVKKLVELAYRIFNVKPSK